MPKRVGHLYEKMLDKSLIRYVIIEGSKGKRKRHDVKAVMNDVDGYVDKVYDMLLRRAFIPTTPRHVIIHDKSSNKEREIGVVPFYPDGIVHRLIVEVAKPIFMRGMYAHSCASIPERGNMHAVKYVKKSLKDVRNTKWCAKMDIYHYYPNIKHDTMMNALRRKFKDEEFLKLINAIITSGKEGLTIGFYLNQWLANVFLESLDHMIIALGGVKYYVRNMDDIVIFGANKKKLHAAVRAIKAHLAKFELELKDNWQVFKVDDRGVDFVGYRFFHGYTLLRKRNFLRLTRQCRKVQKLIQECAEISAHTAMSLLSRIGQLKHCNGENIRRKYFYAIGEGKLKAIVRKESQRRGIYEKRSNVGCK